MSHRSVLSARQRSALFDLPTDKSRLPHHYTLADDDIDHIRSRRGAKNQIGFALQLCALRHPGRLLKPGEIIPETVSDFIAAQLGLKAEDLLSYGAREETRYEHLAALRKIYGYKMCTGKRIKQMKSWLTEKAEGAQSSEGLVRAFMEECQRRHIILPGVSIIERLCADALVAAERRIDARIVGRLEGGLRRQLDSLLHDTVDGRVSHFVWLRQFEVGRNTADQNRQLDRLEFLQEMDLSPTVLDGIPRHRIKALRRQGERYFTGGLQEITSDRRLAILTTCAVEWAAAIADTIVETHDRITGKIWRDAKKVCELRIQQGQTDVAAALAGFGSLGTTLLLAQGDNKALIGAVEASCGWDDLGSLVAMAAQLGQTIKAEPLDHIVKGFHSFKLYAKRMLKMLQIKAAPEAQPLLDAAHVIRDGARVPSQSLSFLGVRSSWRPHLKKQDKNWERLWMVAVMSHLREAFRSNDIWLTHARQYGDTRQVFVPLAAAKTMLDLAMPLDPEVWLDDRKHRMADGLERLGAAARQGAIPGGVIENGELQIDRLTADVPEEACALVLDLYRRLPQARITDLLMDVDRATGFTDAFTHLRTGAPCTDRLGLLNVILAEGLNIGLSKMARATASHDYFQLSRVSRWHVESEALNRALAMVIDAQARLPMAQYWGAGQTASSDGQFFGAARQGEAMNLINAKYGQTPGLKAYTHVSDQYAPFATQVIPATVNEAPYILDGLLMTDAGRKITEQYADTGGFTDLVFAATSLLGYSFIPRIRDLPSKRLHVFEPKAMPRELKALVGDRIRENKIITNWPDALRAIATMVSGQMKPSHLLKQLAARPRQNDLFIALQEIGRVERTLFMIEWALDKDMQRRAQIGLNKGESHHALKNALRVGRQGEIRDRTTEGQHFRIAGLNLLTAIIIFWNTEKLGQALKQRKDEGLETPEHLLAHISPLGWEHILLFGQYIWPGIYTEKLQT